jgi:hypothetical protein
MVADRTRRSFSHRRCAAQGIPSLSRLPSTGVWPGLTREDVEQLATDHSLTIEKVREIAHEKYPDDEHEAARLSQRAPENVRAALIVDLKERGCRPEQVDGWFAFMKAAERRHEPNRRS